MGKPHTWLAGQPAGQIFQKKGLPGGSAGLIRAALFFQKSGRPAGQPTMYLPSPVHFGSILLLLVNYCIDFPYYEWYFPYYALYFLFYECPSIICLLYASTCARPPAEAANLDEASGIGSWAPNGLWQCLRQPKSNQFGPKARKKIERENLAWPGEAWRDMEIGVF